MSSTKKTNLNLNDPNVFGDEENAWGMEKSLDWHLAWQRAVAKAWIDPDYAKLLKSNTSEALLEVGWEVPPGLEIIVRDPKTIVDWDGTVHDHTWSKDVQGKKKKPIPANGWSAQSTKPHDRRDAILESLQTTVIFTLPPKPKDMKESALALADYDGLSRAYPFTCAPF
jgi:hypothetical protein